MDVYSCRDFDASLVEAHLAAKLGAFDVQITDVSHALEYKFEHGAVTRDMGRVDGSSSVATVATA
jgi:hypothetical protein